MNVTIMGDSHVEAMGPLLTRELPSVGVNVLGFTARRGWTVGRYLSAGDVTRLVSDPESGSGGQPDAVIISLGGNDRRTSLSTYRRELERMVNAVRAAGVSRIVWVGPTHSLQTTAANRDAHARHERHAQWQQQVLPGLGVQWIDSRPMTQTGHAPDGLHYTIREGYPRWASQLKHEIAHALAAPASSGGGSAPAGGKSGRSNKERGSTPLWIPLVIVGVAGAVFIGTILLAGPRAIGP